MRHHAHRLPVKLLNDGAVDGVGVVAGQGAVDAGNAGDVAGDEADVVGHDQDGQASVELPEQVKDVALQALVDVGRGLVQDEDAGLAGQGAGEQDPLQLPPREAADAAAGQVQGLHLGQGAVGDLAIGPAVAAGPEPGESPPTRATNPRQQHRLLHRNREVAGKARVLGHIAQLAAGLAGRAAEDPYLAALGGEQAQDEAQQGTLAAGVGTDDPDELPRRHAQADGLQDPGGAVGKVEIPYLDDGGLGTHGLGILAAAIWRATARRLAT